MRTAISCVSLVELEELNSELLEIIVILQQSMFMKRRASKT